MRDSSSWSLVMRTRTREGAALGAPSARTLMGVREGILRARGKWRTHTTVSGKDIPGMPTLHPAYLLRNPAHKKLAWRDFLEIKARLEATGK